MRITPLLLAALVTLLPALSPARTHGPAARSAVTRSRATRPARKIPRQGVWVKAGGNRMRKISFRTFERKFGVKWSRLQTLGSGLTTQTLPGYSEGPGSFDINNLDAPQYVAPQYQPTKADRRAMAGRTARVYIGQVNATVGHGLFARGTIRKGSIIGEYTGVVRNENTKTDRSNGYTFTYDPFGHFPMLVDAKAQGNYMRFANHSAKFSNAAPRMVYDRDQSRWHVLLVATKEIRRGDQVLFNYGHKYGWDRFGITEPTDLKPR